MTVSIVTADRFDELVTVLCDSFFDYPVMRYVIGGAPAYAHRLRTVIGLFVKARVARDDLMLGVQDAAGTLIAAALVNLPGDHPPGPQFETYRDRVWAQLGADARARYDAFGSASHAFDPTDSHHHLGMIGVRASHQGTGLGRRLLERVHSFAEANPDSIGVSLTTEVPTNVPLYEHFGYRVAGHSRVAPELETWSMFRPR